MADVGHQLDREKLKEAVLLIASHCPPEELGNVKLHKILYFSDMLFFLKEGRPLTGVEYLKQKFGPVARHLSAAITQLNDEGALRVEEEDYFGVIKKTYRPQVAFSRHHLSASEVELVKEVADFVRGKSAKEISAISHNAAWESVDLGQPIPYFTAFRLVPPETDESDRQWAAQAAREYAVESLPQ